MIRPAVVAIFALAAAIALDASAAAPAAGDPALVHPVASFEGVSEAHAAGMQPLVLRASSSDVAVAREAGASSPDAPAPAKVPAPTLAWVLAAGFLGVVVLRRSRPRNWY